MQSRTDFSTGASSGRIRLHADDQHCERVNNVACETLDAMCSVCKVHCATWRTEAADADCCWTLDACDDFGLDDDEKQ